MKFLAEYLPRINTITVVFDNESQVVLTHLSKHTLKVHDSAGEVQVIKLPHCISQNSDYAFKTDGMVKVLRLKATDSKQEISLDRSRNFMMSISASKWMKNDLLNSSFEICCLKCKACLITNLDCKKINDMPSEHWAELMDYWHCHKPPIDKDGVHFLDRYSKLKPLQGELLVGESFFLFSEDWLDSRFSMSGDSIACMECQSALGFINRDGLYKIQKWNVVVEKDSVLETFPPEYSVISSIINLVNSNASRYFLIKGRSNISVLVWVFSVGLRITLPSHNETINSIKVFYIVSQDSSSNNTALGDQNVEELAVDDVVLPIFIQKLDETNRLLPKGIQKMDKWKLSYLSCLK